MYPNPFNSSTLIRFTLPHGQTAKLTIYNLAGQRVATLFHCPRPAGANTFRWDGRGDGGRLVTSGVYFYRLRTGDWQETRKLLLLR